MAQIFTLDFSYQGINHSAVVSVRSVGPDQSVHVQLGDDALGHLVPEGELSFRLSNATRRPMAAPRPGYNELEHLLRTAVLQRLRQ
ncbi:hypothetical protein [Flaviaesturariibacter amylovorans]|uniref:Uncharacterized protein n=1 Tax=Flaviaesturariibacter amylovorans TaxID=1084520 RepID=A0ABP8HN79_9BACT